LPQSPLVRFANLANGCNDKIVQRLSSKSLPPIGGERRVEFPELDPIPFILVF